MAQRKHIELFTVAADGERQPALDADAILAAKAILDKKNGRRDVITSPETGKDYLAVQMGALRAGGLHRHLAGRAEPRDRMPGDVPGDADANVGLSEGEVVKLALTLNAAFLILAHNHPSGVCQPSRADEALTQTLNAALSLVDVRVLDRMVVAGGTVLSLAERACCWPGLRGPFFGSAAPLRSACMRGPAENPAISCRQWRTKA